MSKSDSKKEAKIEIEEIPLSIILKFIKPYDGSRERLNAFLNNCDNAHNLASTNQEDLVFKFILSQLEGKAEIACSIKDFDNWASLKEFLKNQFGERKHYAHLLTELQECRQQSNESVSQFSLRVETCLSQLITEITISNNKKSELVGRLATMEDLALNAFIMGLQPRISNMIRCKDPKSLNEAINMSISEEKIQQYFYKQNSYPKPRSEATFRPNNKPQPRPSNDKPQFQSQNVSRDAPFCRYCKRLGHVLENCRMREYNNKKFNNSYNRSSTSYHRPGMQSRVNLVESQGIEDSTPSINLNE